ncbi:MAG: hypothetical protein O9288_17295 [Novosphingobium sp.]|nr:hypothetical protein [Novosphingobium sp.]
MEADPHCCSYAQFDFKAFLPSRLARELDDMAAYTLRHRAGSYVVCAKPPRAIYSSAYNYCWNELDAVLARRNMWLFSATPKELRREPQWSNALGIAKAAQTLIDPSDYERVVAYLSAVGPARVRDCLKFCDSGVDSFDALLGLVSSGVVFLDPPGDLSLDGELRLDPPPGCELNAIGWLHDTSAGHPSER